MMSDIPLPSRAFKVAFTAMGVIYAGMASSMLVRGSAALEAFGVPERVYGEPIVEDFFSFFYSLMAVIGGLMVLFAHVTRERRAQQLVASAFTAMHLGIALRDLSTSDSRFGSRLYHGDDTMAFVYIGLGFALVSGAILLRLSKPARSANARASV